MCILISTTHHLEYPLIVLSNRDEFLGRPTQLATMRKLENGAQIILPLDLGRDEHGTWIGVTSEGRIAMLLNYREKKCVVSKVSRGVLPIQYLSSSLEDDDEWYDSLDANLTAHSETGESVSLGDIGGFSFIYGKLKTDPVSGELIPLSIMSNRGDRGKLHSSVDLQGELHRDVARQKHFSVSNSLYYEPWPKSELGVSKLAALVHKAVENKYTQDELKEACFDILSTDTYDAAVRDKENLSSEQKLAELCNSIFIPPLDTASYVDASLTSPSATSQKGKYYGTRTQTVIMYHKSGQIHYYERDLYDGDTALKHIRNQHFVLDLNRQA